MQNNSGTNIAESIYLRIRSIKGASTIIMNQIRISELNNTLEYYVDDDPTNFFSTEQNSIVISSHIFNNDRFDVNNNGTAKLYINGVLKDTRGYERQLNQDFDDDGSQIFGTTHSSLNEVYFQEFLFYPSDKTDSREEIESSFSIYSA